MQKIFVTRPVLPSMDEYFSELQTIWNSKILTNMGEKHALLETQLKDFLSISEITLFSNGHSALENALEALQISGEVITTPFTFASTTHAIIRKNLRPIFCDINPIDATIDVQQIESRITEKTSAILPVHVYGHVCDVQAIQILAKKYNLKVIYDAAHAFGESLDGFNIAGFGDVSVFSFHATKVFNTIEGGAVVSHQKLIKNRLELLKNFGITSETQIELVGGNAKMNEFQAAMGLCNLRKFKDEVNARKVIINRYRNNLDGISELDFFQDQAKVLSNYGYLPVLFSNSHSRDRAYTSLRNQEIYARKYFYPLTCDFSCYLSLPFNKDVPIARDFAERVLVLPLYPDLAFSDIDRICQILIEAFQ